jgi:hypothetical protein
MYPRHPLVLFVGPSQERVKAPENKAYSVPKEEARHLPPPLPETKEQTHNDFAAKFFWLVSLSSAAKGNVDYFSLHQETMELQQQYY